MKVMMTNDDGYTAQGINTLFHEIENDYEVCMVAPDRERSSCGHAITLTKALRVNRLEENKYTCSGYPADCVLIALGHILKEDKPELVISGINHGANLGQDRYYSGTMAAAREAAFRGIKGIAISLVTSGFEVKDHFETAAKVLKQMLDDNIQEYIPQNCLLNINVPSVEIKDIKGFEISSPGFQVYTEEVIERVDFRETKYYWVGGRYEGHRDISGSDCNTVQNHYVSVDLQTFDNEDVESAREKLKEVLTCTYRKYYQS